MNPVDWEIESDARLAIDFRGETARGFLLTLTVLYMSSFHARQNETAEMENEIHFDQPLNCTFAVFSVKEIYLEIYFETYFVIYCEIYFGICFGIYFEIYYKIYYGIDLEIF